MPYAVMLYFDNQTELAISKVWQTLADNNLTASVSYAGIRPHISLAIYDEIDCQPCENELIKISSMTTYMAINLAYLGIFTNPEPVVFAALIPTKELLDFHENLHSILFSKTKNPWELYKPGKWVPHCTLAQDFKFENLTDIINRCKTLSFPIDVHAAQLGVVEFQPVRDLFKFDFLSFEG
jgi:2'-5' RNA ligase